MAEEKTLLQTLEESGDLLKISALRFKQARYRVTRGMSPKKTAKEVGVEVEEIERWCRLFGWEEERDRREFAQFRRVRENFSPHTDERHDRIAASIEQEMERCIHKAQQDGEEMSPKDLSILASVLKSTMGVRRTVRGKSGPADEKKVDVNINMPENLERLANALGHAVDPLAIKLPEVKRIGVEVEVDGLVGTDEEFEDS